MTHFFHLLLRGLLLLLASFATLSAVILIIRKTSARGGAALDAIARQKTRMIKPVLIFTVGCLVGWFSRDQLQSSRTHTLYNVTILAQPESREYFMQEPGGDAFHTVFCEDVPFKPGNRLKKLTYEDKKYCWSLKGSQSRYYIAQGDEYNGNTNTNPHAKTHTYTVAHANPAR